MTISTKNSGAYAAIIGMQHKKTGTYSVVVGCFAKVAGAYQSVLTPAPLRVASVENRIATVSSGSTGRRDYLFRVRFIPAKNTSGIVLNFYNFHMGTGGTGGPGNTLTIESATVEGPSAAVRATASGANSFTMANLTGDYNMDVVTAASVGLSVFVAGTTYWVKGRVSVPATGNGVPLCDRYVQLTPGERFTWYDPATTTLGNEFGVGNFTLTGGTPDEKGTGFCPIILGYAADGTDANSLVTIGDSNSGGTGDDQKGVNTLGNGFVQRACSDGPTLINQFNMSRLNSTLSAWQGPNAVLPRAYLKYGAATFIKLGGNDIPTDGSASETNLNNFKANMQNLITEVKEAGVQKIVLGAIFTRSTSTDNWVTTANQTVTPGRETGGIVDQANTYMLAKVADGTATSVTNYVAFPTQRDATLQYLWNVTGANGITPGTTNTTDGTHLNPLGHLKASVTLRTTLYSIFSL